MRMQIQNRFLVNFFLLPGLADPQALNQAVAAYQACHFIGMPECDVSTCIHHFITCYIGKKKSNIQEFHQGLGTGQIDGL